MQIYLRIAVIVLLFGLLFIAIKYNYRFQQAARIINTKVAKIENSGESTSVRLSLLNAAFEVFISHPYIGVGTGDIKEHLIEKYKEKKMETSVMHKYNVHNQFLETAVGQGIIGFILLWVLLLLPFYNSIVKNDVLSLFFFFIFIINFMFESMLNTQAGVIFFLFFYCLFTFCNLKNIHNGL
ncbi:MAG: O-antigen ligase family protein [Bacteroidia bacterium]|nr:O-antigen ligase family protein [Bacteroidia bacterium]